MTAAIFFHPDGYSITRNRLMGRHVAGQSFLRGFFRHAKTETLWTQVEFAKHGELFVAAAKEAGRPEPVTVIERTDAGRLWEPGALFYPDSHIAKQAWHRSWFGHGQWSITGVTHTTATNDTMDAIAAILTAPVQPWDALICTSSAVKKTVECVLQAQEEYLRERLGTTRSVMPQLPIIPLGVNADDFVFKESDRARARRQIDAEDDAIVVLFLGRLSFHAKAHPLAMYQALEKAVQKAAPPASVILVECGWFGNEQIRQAYRTAAYAVCPTIRVVTLDGRKAEARHTAWASADIFCSLSDNIQETFGITPIEAMAAGLPVVVSDWDGYRDTVRDGVDGFRIQTSMPAAGAGRDLIKSYASGAENYDRYCGYSCMMTAVDVEAAAAAFERLLSSPDLRAQMGRAGYQRARELFDWAAIIPAYEALWAELEERRQSASAEQRLPSAWPSRSDPFAAFASYPTQTLTEESEVELVDRDIETSSARIDQYLRLAMVDFAMSVLPDRQEIADILTCCARGPVAITAIVDAVTSNRRSAGLRSLAFLLKMGILRRAHLRAPS